MTSKGAKPKKDSTPPPGTPAAVGINNMSIADTMQQIAAMLELKGENRFKIQSYRRAADTLLNMPEDIRDVWRAGGWKICPNIGEAIATKIDELLRTGGLKFYDRLRAEIPPGVLELTAVPDIGPKTAMILYRALGVTSTGRSGAGAGRGPVARGAGLRLQVGRQAAREPGARRSAGRPSPACCWPWRGPWRGRSSGCCARAGVPVQHLEAVGSLRRGRTTIGDMDILCTSPEPQQVIDVFVKLPLLEVGDQPRRQ